MLDVGFSEILVIFVLALIVLGPEKLPRVASQVGRWIGRARGMARQFREQLEEEVNLEQARKAQSAAPPEVAPPAPSPAPPAPLSSEVSATTAATVSQPAPGPTLEPPARHYPDTFSHAHPTDSEGRPTDVERHLLAPDTGPHQQDWVGGVTETPGATIGSDQADNGGGPGASPAKGRVESAYASSDERGT